MPVRPVSVADLAPCAGLDLRALRAAVGAAVFERGEDYAARGTVGPVRWDSGADELAAAVRGSGLRPYEARVGLALEADRTEATTLTCTCPVRRDCKHAVALAVTAVRLARAGLAADDRGAGPGDWRRAVEAWTVRGTRRPALGAAPLEVFAPGAGEPAPPTPLGLRFRVDAALDGDGDLPGLALRPVRRGSSGRWAGGTEVDWVGLQHSAGGGRYAAGQREWFAELGRAHRTDRRPFGSGGTRTWRYAEDFTGAAFWTLLAEARDRGVALVGESDADEVVLCDAATVGLDVRRDAAGGAVLQPYVAFAGVAFAGVGKGAVDDGAAGDGAAGDGAVGDGAADGSADPAAADVVVPAEHAAPVAARGLFAVHDGGGRRRLLLAPATLDAATTALLGSGPVHVPADAVDELVAEHLPALRRRTVVGSSDGSVVVPEEARPVLVLEVSAPRLDRVALHWHWEYRAQGAVQARHPLEIDLADAAATAARDIPAERRVRRVAAGALHGLPGLAGLAPQVGQEVSGIGALHLATRGLPALAALDDVEVRGADALPEYRESTAAPEITATLGRSDDPDWFDLGIQVAVEGRHVPFVALFTALARGLSHLVLEDGTYVRLDQPAFATLRELVEESARLEGRAPTGPHPPRVSRFQAGWWADMADAADTVVVDPVWEESAGALLALRDALDGDATAAPAAGLPAGLHAELRPYQRQAFEWLAFLHHHRLGGILADDMGLGKTLETLALLAHAREQAPGAPPFLVVAPASVLGNWVDEAARFAPGLRVVTMDATPARLGRAPAEIAAGADVVVTTYALLRLAFDDLSALEWSGLVLDEAQAVKNARTRVHECARTLRAPFRLAITGTPLENDLTELWALLSVVAPGLFPSLGRFRDDYVKPVEAGDTARLDRLRRRVRPLLLRRTKEQVAPELPARQEQVLRVELAPRHRRAYDTFLHRERRHLLGLLDDFENQRFAVFRSLTLLRRMALDASLVEPEKDADVPSSKLDALFEQLEEVLAEGHRALVFSQFTSYLGKVADRCRDAGIDFAYLDGATRRRADVVRAFKEGSAPLFLISLKAGGFGLNLTEADYVFLLDPWWNPAAEAQAVDRTHRIGQERPVMVVRLVADGTIEEKVMALQQKKARLVGAVLDDGNASFAGALGADDVRALLLDA
ncbi:SNF2-related protein [Puerhibacterium sp. TATVAM-FAB25]|uniref:SNF2-related protein n=1 Tax=Puerhibacterium sp. TATVAM-FAB25 TaxID=3093699 RepID=UPI00397C04A5